MSECTFTLPRGVYCTGGPCLWISAPVSSTIDSSTSTAYWTPLRESLERRVEELEERTIVDVQ